MAIDSNRRPWTARLRVQVRSSSGGSYALRASQSSPEGLWADNTELQAAIQQLLDTGNIGSSISANQPPHISIVAIQEPEATITERLWNFNGKIQVVKAGELGRVMVVIEMHTMGNIDAVLQFLDFPQYRVELRNIEFDFEDRRLYSKLLQIFEKMLVAVGMEADDAS